MSKPAHVQSAGTHGRVSQVAGVVASLDVLGSLCRTFGEKLKSYFNDNVATFCKQVITPARHPGRADFDSSAWPDSRQCRHPEPGARVAAVAGLCSLLQGSAQLTNVTPVSWSAPGLLALGLAISTDFSFNLHAKSCDSPTHPQVRAGPGGGPGCGGPRARRPHRRGEVHRRHVAPPHPTCRAPGACCVMFLLRGTHPPIYTHAAAAPGRVRRQATGCSRRSVLRRRLQRVVTAAATR